MIRPVVTIVCAALSVACAASQPAAPPAASHAANPVESVAALLASIEARADAGDNDDLARSLARLDALGARPAEGMGDDPVERWRASAAGDAIPYRGRALGPAYRRGTLAAEGELELTQTFLSGKKAVIAVSSPAGTAPALRVVSASGTTVCDSAASCRWIPTFTERYAIILRNPSRTARTYYLVVD